MLFQANTIKDYHTSSGLRHPFYDKSCSVYTDLKIHYYDDVPNDLISERRPGESDKIKEYREKIRVNITQNVMWGISGSLNKIRKSKDYVIDYRDQNKLPAIINEDETPKKYFEEKFGNYTSITNWTFSALLTQYMLDAGGVVLTMHDITKEVAPNEYLKPLPTIYNSDQVIDYIYGEWYVLKSKEVSYYTTGKGKNEQRKDGAVYYTVTTDTIQRFVQTSSAGDFMESHIYVHNLGRTPVTMIYGVVVEDNLKNYFCKSRFSPMVPHLKEMYREYSDVQAEVVQHIHSTLWAYQSQECKMCKGTGTVMGADKDKNAVKLECEKCRGKGVVAINPYETVIVTPAGVGESPTPTPPMGYITKDTAIVTLQDKRIADHRYYALASVNMENSSTIPLNISGTAKEQDKQKEFDTYHAINEDLSRIDDMVAKDCIDLRYLFISEEEREKFYPSFPVCDKFDIVGSDEVIENLRKLTDVGVDPSIINATELEYVNRAFATMPQIKEKLLMLIELDPLRGMSDDSILAAGDTITELKKYIHYNINTLIDSLYQDKSFVFATIPDKREMLKVKAMEELTAIQTEKKKNIIPIAPTVVNQNQ